MTKCAVEGCIKSLEPSRKLCSGHRRRLRRTGSTDGPPIKTIPPKGVTGFDVVLFNGWTVTESGCWEYRGPRFAKGYGQVKVNGQPCLVHRESFKHFVGEIPEGLIIRHTCDNPPCMNPQHLIPGTDKQNAEDREERGRTARGDRGRGLLTDQQVMAIRHHLNQFTERISRGREMSKLAEEYGVSKSTIGQVYRRRRYAHVG